MGPTQKSPPSKWPTAGILGPDLVFATSASPNVEALLYQSFPLNSKAVLICSTSFKEIIEYHIADLLRKTFVLGKKMSQIASSLPHMTGYGLTRVPLLQ